VRLALSGAEARGLRAARRVLLTALEADTTGRPKTTIATRRVRLRA
jgi:hypothetical protein